MKTGLLGLDTNAIDFLYSGKNSDGQNIDAELRDKFLKAFNCNPGVCETQVIDNFQETVLQFARDNNIQIKGEAYDEKVEYVMVAIFGTKVVKPGGALANTFDVVVNSNLNGKPLVQNPVFVTAVAGDKYGSTFYNSLPQGTIFDSPRSGGSTIVHVFSIGGQRTMIATLPKENSWDVAIGSIRTGLESMEFKNFKMVIISGYLIFSGHFNGMLDIISNKISELPRDEKPTVVLTLAAKGPATSKELKDTFDKLAALTNVIVISNAGEFRRFLNMDTNWRETSNSSNVDQERQQANNAAFEKAGKICSSLDSVTFVVTDGPRNTNVITKKGISTYKTFSLPNEFVNTVGAGDAFTAGFILGLYRELAEKECVDLGHFAAGYVVGCEDARLPAKTSQKHTGLLAYLEESTLHFAKPMLKKLAGESVGFSLNK